MIVGCYTLDLYCDVPLDDWRHRVNTGYTRGYGVAQYTGKTGSGCRVQARYDGWKLDLAAGTATCPTCVKANRSPG